MLRAFKIRLYPTEDQEKQFFSYIGATRYVWNYFLEMQEKAYKAGEKYISCNKMGKMLVELKHTEDHLWLQDIAHHTLINALRNLDFAYQLFFKGINGVPKFKARKKCKASFYTRSERLTIRAREVKLDSFTPIKAKIPEQLQFTREKVHNATVLFENNKWLLIVNLECEKQAEPLSNVCLGIDVGLKEYMTVAQSDGVSYTIENINKTSRVRKLESKRRYVQSKLSTLLKANGYTTSRRSNYYSSLLTNITTKLRNIRKDYMYKSVHRVLSVKPQQMNIETLNVISMRDMKPIREYLETVALGRLLNTLTRKAEEMGTVVVKLPERYPSSKRCSRCGGIQDMPIDKREYICPHCGLRLDRDTNAAYNILAYR